MLSSARQQMANLTPADLSVPIVNHVEFVERFLELAKSRSRLCVGVDPSKSELARWGLPDSSEGLRFYCDAIIDAAVDKVAVLKPQAAFFERHGPDGMRQMREVIAKAKEAGVMVILDAKRGDIAHSAQAYGEAYLGVQSAYGADAITLSPYLGVLALRPIVDIAIARDAAIFVVVRSSNPEGRKLQTKKLQSSVSLSHEVAADIFRINKESGFGGIGAVGAVMGATIGEVEGDLLLKLKRSLILVPGIGVQGASVEDAQRVFSQCWKRVIPTVSRGISRAGPDPKALRERVECYVRKVEETG